MEQRTCQNCKQQFTIDEQDQEFYARMNVPAPTFCYLCRAQRRFIWRNERFLYRTKSAFSGKEIFSMFPPESYVKSYENNVYFSDQWDSLEYGRAVDFSRPFLEQFFELLKDVPHMALSVSDGTMINSDYSNNASYLKNCYLVFNADNCEDCLYSDGVFEIKDCMDVRSVTHTELAYESFWLDRSSNIFFSSFCENSHDIYFSRNLRGCSNCFGCVNLRNKSYYIFNKPHSKEEYGRKLKEFHLESYQGLQNAKQQWQEFALKFPRKSMEGRSNVEVSGEYISNSKNARDSYQVREAEDVRYCQFLLAPTNKNCMDFTIWGMGNAFVYESLTCGLGTNNLKFVSEGWPSVSDLQYCRYIQSSSNLFGCVSMRNKKYCILNKQYAQEEYEQLMPKIIEHMNAMPYTDKRGHVYRYGEFFPLEFSPFAYNQTIAQEHFPLTKESVQAQELRWKDSEERQLSISIKADDLPDSIADVSDSIVQDVIGCQHAGNCNGECTKGFRIISQELRFYKNAGLPLPRLCPNCRHAARTLLRNPIGLWKRDCMCGGEASTTNLQQSTNNFYKNATEHFHKKEKCPNVFETSYSPERKEIVYCEQCYLAEVD